MIGIAGIDVSTKAIDVVVLRDEDLESPQHWRIDLGKGVMLDRIRRIDDGWYDTLPFDLAHTVHLYGIERPAGRFGAWQASLAVGGVLQCIAPDARVEWFLPGQWRKRCGLHGNASKGTTMAWVRETFGLDWSQDASDALGVAWAMRSLVRESENE